MSLSEDGPSGQSGASHVVRDAVWRAIRALDHLDVVLLRPATALDQGGDVDLLVDPRQLRAAVESLVDSGFRRLDHGDPADGHLVTHDAPSCSFVWVHLQTRVRAPGIELDTSSLLRSVTVDDGVPVVAAEWLFWVLMVHTVFERGTVPVRHRHHLTSLASEARSTVDDVRGALAAVGCDAERLLTSVAGADWDAVDRLASHLPGGIPWTERLRGRLVRVRRLGRSDGLSVAAIGPDGAGKTSLMAGLEATLPAPTVRLYLGLTGGRLPAADRLRIPGVVFVARVLLLWMRHLVIVVGRRLGKVVLVDRHVLDGRVPSGVPIGPLRRRARLVESRVVPVPDVLFVLDAPGSVLHDRSGEYDPDTLERWRAAYRAIADETPRAVVLDATAPASDVLREAQAVVWSALSARFSSAGRG